MSATVPQSFLDFRGLGRFEEHWGGWGWGSVERACSWVCRMFSRDLCWGHVLEGQLRQNNLPVGLLLNGTAFRSGRRISPAAGSAGYPCRPTCSPESGAAHLKSSSHARGRVLHFVAVLISVPLMMNDVERPFAYLFASHTYSFVKCLFRTFVPFHKKLGCFFFFKIGCLFLWVFSFML